MTSTSQISPSLFLNEALTQADLAGSRLCQAAMITLRYTADEGGISLTKSGAFHRKFVVWAVDQFQWPHYTANELAVVNKVLNEDDVPPLAVLHDVLWAAKLIRHTKGKAILTGAGKAVIGEAGRLQVVLFETFFTTFDFAEHERWPIEMPDDDTLHYLGVVRNRLDDWVGYPEFAAWCLPIFALPAQRGTPEEDAMFYLATRLVRPLTWLGLLEQREPARLSPIYKVELRKTPLFDRFIRIEPLSGASGSWH